MGKTIKRLIISGVIFLIVLIVMCSSLYHVNTNEYAIVKQLGKIVTIDNTPGLRIKIPFIQSVQKIYAGNHIYDIPTSDVITKDKKSMIADDYVIWKVIDAKKYYQSLGGISGRAEERIDAAVYNATKNVISAMTQDEIIAARGTKLTELITTEANSDIAEYGLAVITAEIKALDLPETNKNAVYERMISERNNIAAGYTAQGNADAQVIRNETDKQVKILTAEADKDAEAIIAEGEAEYMKILSDAYNIPEKAEFYNYIRSLDALKVSLSGGNKTLLLDKSSELAKILYFNE